MLAEQTEHIWHFWIAVPLALGAIVTVLAILGLYLSRVVRTRYPNT
jgi:hypothetical protein